MKRALLVLASGILTACASTPPQYYSLLAPGLAGDRQSAPSVAPVRANYAISVQPVVVPEEVARPQIVVSTSDNAEVIPLNAALWAAPLESQLRQVLGDALARRLNVMDVGQSGVADGLPLWRIYVDVQRFDSIYGESVQQHVVWRMVPQGMPSRVRERVCSARIHQPVASGMTSLVEGHRQGINWIAGAIADAMPGKAAPKPFEKATVGGGLIQFRGCVG